MDGDSLERELRALHPASFAWALACSGYSRDEAEELLQEVYLKLVEGRARFGGRSGFKTWLFAVIRVTAKERWRRSVREQLGLGLFGIRQTALAAADTRAAVAPPDETERLRAALKVLPRRQREVLELVFYHELSIEEASAVMAVSLGTARTHYERGKQRLRDLLQKVRANHGT